MSDSQKPLPPELHALVAGLCDDPRDVVALQALADWLEERGADRTASLRTLRAEDGDVILLGVEEEQTAEDVERVMAQTDVLRDWLRSKGKDVRFAVVSGAVTIRQFRAGDNGGIAPPPAMPSEMPPCPQNNEAGSPPGWPCPCRRCQWYEDVRRAGLRVDNRQYGNALEGARTLRFPGARLSMPQSGVVEVDLRPGGEG